MLDTLVRQTLTQRLEFLQIKKPGMPCRAALMRQATGDKTAH
jgi:hypothetical protein